MVITELYSLRTSSDGCNFAVSSAKFVRFVILYLGFMFGLEFSIPFLGFLLLFGWVRALPTSETLDFHTCNEDLVDWRLPGRSSFQWHIDLVFVLLGPFQKPTISSLTWGSVWTFGFGVFPHQAMVEKDIEPLRFQPETIRRTSIASPCVILFMFRVFFQGVDVKLPYK